MSSKKKKKPIFTVGEERLLSQPDLRREIIDTSLFVLPKNDGEAARACQILAAVKAPFVHISKQNWGATLDREWASLDLAGALEKKIKRVVIFEIPGVAEAKDMPIDKEEAIKAMGFDLLIIDHHHYKWVDRYQPKSSLEQLCSLIGWQMDEIDMAIAINDRSYIPGLKSLGISVDVMRQVRLFDLENQGNSRSYIEKQLQLARSLLGELTQKKKGDIWVLDEPSYKQPYIVQEISFDTPSGLTHAFEIKPHKLGFSGDPRVVDKLLKRDFSKWEKITGPLINYGGGDGRSSKFWGLKTSENRKTIPPKMAEETLEFILEERAGAAP